MKSRYISIELVGTLALSWFRGRIDERNVVNKIYDSVIYRN